MLYPYRVLRQDVSIGIVEDIYYTTLIDAYRACIPDSTSHCCHLMFTGVNEKLNNGENLIRVTCYTTVVYWLERLLEKNDHAPIPELPSKIECCHHPD